MMMPKNTKSNPLAWFFIKILRSSLSDIEVYRNRYAQLQKLSESGLTVLNCFKSSPEKRLKVSDIEKDTSLPRRTVQYALQTLTKKAFIPKIRSKSRNPLSADFLIIQTNFLFQSACRTCAPLAHLTGACPVKYIEDMERSGFNRGLPS